MIFPSTSRTVILAGIFAGYSAVYSWFGRTETFFNNVCTSALAMRSLELRGHHVAIQQRDSEQVRQAVIRLFLGADEFVHAVEAAAGEVVSELENLSLNGNHLPGIDLVLRSEFDHAMHGRLRVDHRVVFLNGALDDALVPLLVPVNVDLHSQEMVDAQWALDHL